MDTNHSARRVFTREKARAEGITDRQLASTQYQRLFYGTYLAGSREPTLEEWIAAAQLVLPVESMAAGRTAMQLVGIDSGPRFPLVLATAQPVRVRRSGIATLTRPELVQNMADAWREVCRTEDLLTAVALGDRAVHRGLLNTTFFANQIGVAAGPASALVRAGAESWRESWLRLCVVLSGLPEPELQVEIRHQGRFVGRVDGLFRAQRVVLEYDGEQHRTDDAQFGKDIDRTESLAQAGYLHIRVAKSHLPSPWTVVERVAEALSNRGLDVRPRRTPLWRQIFDR